jgi:hypothetical protein
MTHLFRQGKKSNRFPVRIILVEGPNCLCYELSSRIDGLPVLQPLVLLDKEKNVVLRAIDNIDISFYVPVFATNKQREIHARACHSVSMSIAQNLEKLDGKIIHSGFTQFGDHGNVKQIDQFCVASYLHRTSVNIV